MGAIFTNNASSTLAAGISAAATSLTVQTGHGARFPALAANEWFPLTLVKSATELEIVRCTARSGDTLTIERAQDGTTALAFDAGDFVEHRLTAEVLNEVITVLATAMQIGAFGIGSTESFLSPAGLANIRVTDIYRYSSSDPDSPDGSAGVVIAVAFDGGFGAQIAIGTQSTNEGNIWVRRVLTVPADPAPRTFSTWRLVAGMAFAPMVNRERYKFTARLDGTASENNATLAAAVAEANSTYGPGAELHVTSGLITSPPNFAGLRSLVGTKDTILDASGRSTNGTIVNAGGSLGATTYGLAVDAAAGSWTIWIPNALADTMGLTKGMWLLLRSNLKEVPTPGAHNNFLAPAGEWVQISKVPHQNPIYRSATNTQLLLNRPLRREYKVAEGACVKIPTIIPPFSYERITLVGPGQTIVPDPAASTDGNNGLAIQFCEDAQWLDCKVYFAERNAFRNNMNVLGYSENCRAQFSRPRGQQIQYGFANNGASRRAHHRNFRSELGRHGIDFSATEGFLEEAIEENCYIEGTYSAAYAEHDGVIDRQSIDCVVDACGSGWDYRGGGNGFGSRRNIHPIVKSTQSNPQENGTLNGAPNAAFGLRDNAGNIEIRGMDVKNVDYILRAEHVDGSDPLFDFAGVAPGRVKFIGGQSEKVTRGFVVINEGSVMGNGAYNLTKAGPFIYEGVKMRMTPRDGGASSIRPIYMHGLISEVVVDDCHIEFPGGEIPSQYAADIRGVDRLKWRGGQIEGSLGILTQTKLVHNGSGSMVAKAVDEFDITEPPKRVNNPQLMALAARPPKLVMPRPSQKSTYSDYHTGGTSEVLLATLKSDEWVGRQGHIRVRGAYHHSGSGSVTYRVALNGTDIYTLASPNGAISVERNIQNRGADTTKRQFFGGWNTAGSAAFLQSLSINTSAGVTVEFFATLADGGDSVRLDVGLLEIFPND